MRIKRTAICLFFIICSVIAVNVSSKLKYKSQTDAYAAIEKLASEVKIMLPADSLITISNTYCTEELLTYLRFCLIPQKVKFSDKMEPGLCLLLASNSVDNSIRQKIDNLSGSSILWQQQYESYSLILVDVHE